MMDVFIQQMIALVNQVRSLIDMHQVVCAGPFLYAYLREVSNLPAYLPCSMYAWYQFRLGRNFQTG